MKKNIVFLIALCAMAARADEGFSSPPATAASIGAASTNALAATSNAFVAADAVVSNGVVALIPTNAAQIGGLTAIPQDVLVSTLMASNGVASMATDGVTKTYAMMLDTNSGATYAGAGALTINGMVWSNGQFWVVNSGPWVESGGSISQVNPTSSVNVSGNIYVDNGGELNSVMVGNGCSPTPDGNMVLVQDHNGSCKHIGAGFIFNMDGSGAIYDDSRQQALFGISGSIIEFLVSPAGVSTPDWKSVFQTHFDANGRLMVCFENDVVVYDQADGTTPYRIGVSNGVVVAVAVPQPE